MMTIPRYLHGSLLSALLAIGWAVSPIALRANLPATTTGSGGNLTVVYPATVGTVTTGITTSTLTITSTAPITVLNWANFWDGTTNGGNSSPSDTINFALPGATSSILNNISSGNSTFIDGHIISNGKVYLLNPAGIEIGPNANISVAGFYGSTIPENLAYFEANGNLQVFTSTPQAVANTQLVVVDDGATIATVGGGGDVRFAAFEVDLAGGTIQGNVFLTSTGDPVPSGVFLAYDDPVTIASTTTGGVTVGGNLTINSHAGVVDLSDSNPVSVAGNLAITSGGQIVIAFNPVTVGGTTSVNTTDPRANGFVFFEDLDTKGLTVVTGTGSSTADGGLSIANLTLGTTGGVANTVSVTGGPAIIEDDNDATLTLGNMTISGNLDLTAGNNLATQNFGSTAATPAVVMVTTTAGIISLFADNNGTNGKTINFNGAGPETIDTLAFGGTGGKATVTTTGNISLIAGSSFASSALSLKTTSGSITQAATADIVQGTALTVNAPTVNLSNPGNAFTSATLLGGGTGGITLVDAPLLGFPLTLAKGTATTGNVSISTIGSVELGAANADALSFGGNLTIALTGPDFVLREYLSTLAGTVSVSGNTTITSSGGGSIAGVASTTPGASSGNAIALGVGGTLVTQAYNFTGPVSITVAGTTGGNVSVWANSAIALGATSTGGALITPANLSVISALTGTANSGITNAAGVVNVTGTTTLASGTKAAPSSIQVGGTANPAVLLGTITANTGYNVSVTNSLATVVGAGTNPITGLTTLTQSGAGAASAVTTTAALNNLSVRDTGTSPTGNVGITIPAGNNVTLTNLAVKGTGVLLLVQTLNGSITLGSGIVDTNTGSTAFTAQGVAASIADTANSPVSIFGLAAFSSDGPINLSNNTASSIGGVNLTASTGAGTNNGNITYTEGGTVNLQAIAVPGTYSGTVAITSISGNIIDTATSTLTTPASAKLVLMANSTGGAVLLSSPTAATDAISSPVTITADTNSAIWSTTALILGNVSVPNGTFAANTSRTAGGAGISLAVGTTAGIYGSTTFVTNGSTVAMTNSGNNFGGLTIDTTFAGISPNGANATIKEFSGNNYVSANTGLLGNFSATSEQSIILETGNTGIRAGGTVTLNAPHGSIGATATGNNFNLDGANNPLVITSSGNAVVSETGGGSLTVLGNGTNVGGNLMLTNTSANGTIRDNGITGNVTVTGNAAFVVATTGTGSINFTGANNTIPNVQLKAGSGTSVFQSNSNINVLPGTLVVGPATISAGGAITMATVGPLSFAGTLSLNAQGGTGNITLADTSAIFNAQVTAVTAVPTGDVNFSALSLATNFNGIAPAVTTANNATYYQVPAP